jgi:thioredoxin-like negative regulator of GroEL
MKRKLLIFTILALLSTLTTSKRRKKRSRNRHKTSNLPTEKNIIILTDHNFESVLAKFPHVFVHFYVPFCSHSKDLSNLFQKAYNKYYRKKKEIRFAKINAYAHKKYSKRLKLRGYPQLLLFSGGKADKFVQFQSDAALYDLRSFIDVHVFQRIRRFRTYESYSRNKLGFEIAFLGSREQHPKIFEKFVELAKNATLYRFVHLPQTRAFYYGLTHEG